MLSSSVVQPPSFKDTPLGPLPEDWDVVPLSNLLTLRGEIVQPQDMSDSRYVGLEHIDSGKSKLQRWGVADEVRSAKAHFYPQDVLYGKLRPYLDKAVLAEWEGICSTDILVFKALPTTLSDFVVHVLHTKKFIDHAISTTSGVNHPRTSWNSLRDFFVPLPPLPEQRAIARVLTTVREAIEATDRVLIAARELKCSLMHHLFTYGPVPVHEADQVSLKDTEIGYVPEAWEIKPLGELADIDYGIQAAVANDTDPAIGIPILTNINVTLDGKIDLSTLRYYIGLLTMR